MGIESLEAAVGRVIKAEREEHGITLDQLATTMREHGVPWSTARVIEFEKGRPRLTLPIVLSLLDALAWLTDRRYTLSDLIPDDAGLIRITDEWTTSAGLLREALDGYPTSLPFIVGDVDSTVGNYVRQRSDLVEELADQVDVAPPFDVTLAEERAARRLGVRPRQVAMWSHLLWGTHLDAEVTRRAGSKASPQARGHVTRELVREIENKIEEHRGEDG